MLIDDLFPLPLFLYAFFNYFSFSSFPRSTAVLDGNIRGFINFPSLVFAPTGNILGIIRKADGAQEWDTTQLFVRTNQESGELKRKKNAISYTWKEINAVNEDNKLEWQEKI